MPNKPTYDFVKNQFEKEGYTLISGEYINSGKPLEYLCKNNHEGRVNYHDWLKGVRCGKCYLTKVKYTLEDVQQLFLQKGYTVLDKSYKNNSTPINYMCSKGHHHRVALNDFNKGHTCPYCRGTNRHTIGEIRELFNTIGYKLLETSYINNEQKLLFECDKGHQHTIALRAFLSGQRCAKCLYKYNNLTIEEVSDLIAQDNYILLSTDYRNSNTQLKCRCPSNHVFNTNLVRWLLGRRCRKCSQLKNSGKSNHFWKGGVSSRNLPLYETYHTKLSILERTVPVEVDGLTLLGTFCTYCNKLFIPTASSVERRYRAFLGTIQGEHRLYCSEGCKNSCSIYRKVLYPEGFKEATPREVQPQLRKLVFERDFWECQKCGSIEGVLHCHHLDPVIHNPVESADVDNCITLCAKCQKFIHKNTPHCNYSKLRCK